MHRSMAPKEKAVTVHARWSCQERILSRSSAFKGKCIYDKYKASLELFCDHDWSAGLRFQEESPPVPASIFTHSHSPAVGPHGHLCDVTTGTKENQVWKQS